MRVNHQRRLLNKAAEARDYQITIRQRADASWPGDHSRLTALESTGHLRRIDPLEDPGCPVAVWQITAAGLSQLRALSSGAE